MARNRYRTGEDIAAAMRKLAAEKEELAEHKAEVLTSAISDYADTDALLDYTDSEIRDAAKYFIDDFANVVERAKKRKAERIAAKKKAQTEPQREVSGVGQSAQQNTHSVSHNVNA